MKKLLLLLFVLLGFASQAQQTFWEEESTGFVTTSTTQGQISYADANTIWTYASAGDGSGDFYQQWGRSIDGGVTWTSGTITLPSTDLAPGSIHAISATTAYVAVFPNAATVQGGIWRTTDSGASWVKQTTALFNTGTESFPDLIHFWGTDTGVALGDPAGGYFEIYTTTNGGTNWTRVPSTNIPAPLDGEYGYTHNFDVVGNTIWCGTNKGRLYKSVDQGLNWTVSQSPIADFGSATISGNYAFRPLTGTETENQGLLISSDSGFWRTTDGGVTWAVEVPVGNFRNFDIAFVPGTADTYVTTGVDPSNIGRGSSYSTDGGVTWIDINDFDTLPVDGGGALEFYDPTHGLASGFTADSVTGGIWKWINDATTLAKVDFTSSTTITASPNPTTGVLNVSGKNISQIAVYDILGKEVSNTSYSALSNVSLNLSSLNAGVYMVKVSNDLGNTSTIKVVKQ